MQDVFPPNFENSLPGVAVDPLTPKNLISMIEPFSFKNLITYPVREVEENWIQNSNSLQLSIQINRSIGIFDVLIHDEGRKIDIVITYSDFVEAKDSNPSFAFPDLKDSKKKSHPLSWKEVRERTSLEIICDTKGLPIYIDGQMVGISPLKGSIDVLPGWHKVGYFPNDYSKDSNKLTSKEKMLNDIILKIKKDIYNAQCIGNVEPIEFMIPYPSMCSLIEGQNIKYSKQKIINNPSLTNLEFYNCIQRTANWLESIGAKPKQPIIIPQLNYPQSEILLYGIWQMGAVAVINANLDHSEIENQLNDLMLISNKTHLFNIKLTFLINVGLNVISSL